MENSPTVQVVEAMKQRVRVADTDTGKELSSQVEELKALIAAYRSGLIKEA